MRNIVLVILLSVLGLCGELFGAVNATEVPVVNPNRAYVIDGEINNGNIFPIGVALVKRAMAGDTKAPVDLIIASPGGSVVTGFVFINAMSAAQAMGLEIRCFVPTIAASMAFQVLVHCNERYTLDDAFLLWHRARIFYGGFGSAVVALTGPELLVQGRDLEKLDAKIFHECYSTLGMDKKLVRYHFENETLHVGSDLAAMAPNFITSYQYIPGLMEALLNMAVPHSSTGDVKYKQGQIIYILPEFSTAK